MTTYEIFDHIADSVNPVLGLIALSWAWIARGRGSLGVGVRAGVLGNVATLVSVAIVYLVGALEKGAGLWAAMGLDYSTHTAVCVAIIVSLWWIDRRAGILATALGVLYAGLMLYQKYHSVGDIAATAVVIAGSSFLVCVGVARFRSVKRI
jgi:hypothetical protein